jgi:ZIP family zinc transporter
MDPIFTVFFVALIAGMATGVGALPVFIAGRISHRIYDASVGLAAGVMFGASVFTLILPGMEHGTMVEVMAGIGIGGGFLLLANKYIPHVHMHFSDSDGGLSDYKRKALLVASSITLHNFPEGLAIGIAFGSGMDGVGLALGIAIGVQNIPDGFAMAIPADKADVSKLRNIAYTTMSGGIPEPVAAVVGFGLVQLSKQLFPVAAGFAAGAMMTVIFREMIPSSHGHGYSDTSTITFIAGFILMMFIDTTFTV